MFEEQGAHGTELTRVSGLAEAETYLATRAVDIILLDLRPADAEGLVGAPPGARLRAAPPSHDLHATSSLGVSIYPDDILTILDDGLDPETLIGNAEAAIYQVKKNDHHRAQFFKPAMNARAVERQSIEEAVRDQPQPA